MEQKKKEYASPNMKEVKLSAQVVLLDASNKNELGLAPMPCDTEHLA
jgi:hypothetical protein